MLDRLTKAFGVLLLLGAGVVPALAGWHIGGAAWATFVLGCISIAVTSGLCLWMLGLDRALPGTNRLRMADGLFHLSWVLPAIALAGLVGSAMMDTAGMPSLTQGPQFVALVLGGIASWILLAPAFDGPPKPAGLDDVIRHHRLAVRHEGGSVRPAAFGNVRGAIPLRIEWHNDANGISYVSIELKCAAAGFSILPRPRIEWTAGMRTRDAAFDDEARIEGDGRRALEWLDDHARAKARAAVASGCRFVDSAWRFDGIAPTMTLVVGRLLDAAESLSRTLAQSALAERVRSDRVDGVRLLCLCELLMIGERAPREALADAHVPVRVLAAIALGDDPEARAVLERDAIPAVAALLSEFDGGPIAERLIAIIAERSGRSAVKTLTSFAARTNDDALRAAAKAAIARVEQRADGEAGHLSVDESHAAGQLSEPADQGQLSLRDPRVRSRT